MNNIDEQLEQKNEIFSSILKEAFIQAINNKNNLENKGTRLSSINIAVLTAILTLLGILIKDLNINFEKYLCTYMYLISILVMVFLSSYLAFETSKARIGVMIGNPKELSKYINDKTKTTFDLKKIVNNHFIDLINEQINENEKIGAKLLKGSKIFKVLLFSIPFGILLFLIDIISEKNNIKHLIFRFGFISVYLSIVIIILGLIILQGGDQNE